MEKQLKIYSLFKKSSKNGFEINGMISQAAKDSKKDISVWIKYLNRAPSNENERNGNMRIDQVHTEFIFLNTGEITSFRSSILF